ncbi:LLM class flavin-dependent oxidoreductase [Tersicoccus sp. Bi-70]|uniref:LLM class flavin-dependent oxidoreductase n=1 Tax=Tersicoccus sp. Bi-70 TaxID=1897634 RepID=UPI001E5C1DC2|nr:LLM class flavin-dependent oxidoreductase [Tersicoccus sp. Bi-70]
MNTPSHINHGLWTHPGNRRHEYTDIGYWLDTARLLERGLFDALFLADVVGTYDVYAGSRDPAIERGIQSPNNDPFLVVPAMAAVTEHLGFAVTFTTTYEPPFGNARRSSTLDHLTRGRVAWNVVTGYLPDAARNYGLDAAVRHDDRYDLAEEFLEVSYKLWEGSWEDDAVERDREHRRYSDPAKVHEIGHRDTTGYLVHFGGGTGIDLAAHGAEEYIEYRGLGHVESSERSFADHRTRQIIDHFASPERSSFLVIGSVEQVADRIEAIAEETGVDGFNLIQYLSPGTFEDFIDLVVPELQRRGRYRTAYRPGESLRERLGADGARLPGTHPAAAHRRHAPAGTGPATGAAAGAATAAVG